MGIVNLAGKYALVVSKYKMPMLSQLKFLTAEFFSAEKKRAMSHFPILYSVIYLA